MRTLTGIILIDAGHSALNNEGAKTERGKGKTSMKVKKIRLASSDLPYVSPQAFRFWWRTTIIDETANAENTWIPSPITRTEATAYTQANPIKYADDDIFGYMLMESAGSDKEEKTRQRRISPLKCTPLISVLRNVLKDDEASMMRQEGSEVIIEKADGKQILSGHAVRYSQEWYATILEGAFSLTLDSVGVFDIGQGYDIDEKKGVLSSFLCKFFFSY